MRHHLFYFLYLLNLKVFPLLLSFLPICFFFYKFKNHKHILTKYYNHQEHTYCYLGGSKSTMLEENLLKKITKIKILKEEREVKKKKIIK